MVLLSALCDFALSEFILFSAFHGFGFLARSRKIHKRTGNHGKFPTLCLLKSLEYESSATFSDKRTGREIPITRG